VIQFLGLPGSAGFLHLPYLGSTGNAKKGIVNLFLSATITNHSPSSFQATFTGSIPKKMQKQNK
jgi:hypothetical protein